MTRAEIVCRDCGQVAVLQGHGRCVRCYARAYHEAAKKVCPCCGQRAVLGSQDGICAACRRSARPHPSWPRRVLGPVISCVACGQQAPHRGRGRCVRCYRGDSTRVHEAAERLANDRGELPSWWTGFAAYLADRLVPDRAIPLLRLLAPHLTSRTTATAALTATASAARENSALARLLRAYFVHARMMPPDDPGDARAASARSRRISEVPAGFRDLVAEFDTAQLQAQQRSRRTGTKPRSDRTLEIHLSSVRDLARFLTSHRPAVTGWQLVTRSDVEAFLATSANPASRARHLNGLRVFFRWARTRRLLLVDPTGGLHATSNFGFHGQVLDTARQRDLVRRWTAHAERLDPNEPAVGLLGLLHGASVAELRHAHTADVDLPAATIRLGRRPQPTPLDPLTTAALRRLLHRRQTTGTGNPHLLINQTSKTIAGPVSNGYLERLLAPAGVTPQLLRATRLADLVTTLDPLLVARAFGIRHGAALHHLADTVDSGRLLPPAPANL